MADAFTGSTALANQIQTAYDRVAFMALRNEVVFSQIAKVKPGNVDKPGTPVTFTFWADMAAATTALSETIDVDAVALSDSQVSITPAEYGNAIIIPARARADTFILGFDADAANIVAYNMADTLDTLARTALDGGTNEDWVGQTTETALVAANIITADEVRQKHAELVAAAVQPAGGLFQAYIHPHVSYDLKGETGDGAWVAPHQYVNTENLYNNEIGTFAGFRFVETARCLLSADAGSGTVDVYTTYFTGSEGLGYAESIPPHMVVGPVTDKLRRMASLGWYGYLQYDTLREAAVRRLKSASSIGSN